MNIELNWQLIDKCIIMSDTEKSLQEPDLHFHFVKPEDETPTDLTACFEVSAKNGSLL